MAAYSELSPTHLITQALPGHTATGFLPGDIGLVAAHKPTIIHELIQARERVDFGHTAWTNLTHAFAIIDEQGTILEANPKGIERHNISKYHDADYYVIHVAATSIQRDLCVARWLTHENDPYDKLNYVGQAITALFGYRISVDVANHFICSGYACYGGLAYEVDYEIAALSMTPAHIAAHYNLQMDESPQPLTFIGKVLNIFVTIGHIVAHIT